MLKTVLFGFYCTIMDWFMFPPPGELSLTTDISSLSSSPVSINTEDLDSPRRALQILTHTHQNASSVQTKHKYPSAICINDH